MRPSEILRLIHAIPFCPFRVCVSDGTVYEIRHPEVIIVTREALRIHTPQLNELDNGLAIVSYFHITRLELILRSEG